MAERRMFSKAVVLSARFLRMPPTSRLLYYDLGIAADDDGIVEAFTVIRTTGAAEDDLRLLAAKGFIVVLNDDLVSLITDWTKNNHIRKDRYTPSQYAYLIEGYPNDNQRLTEGTPFDNQRVTQDSIGQYSLGKARLEKDSSEIREMDNAEMDKGRTFTSPPQGIFAEPSDPDPDFDALKRSKLEYFDAAMKERSSNDLRSIQQNLRVDS